MSYRFGFVIEQVLGHVTVLKNLKVSVSEFPEIEPTWVPVEYDNPYGRVPILNRNWSFRCGFHARDLARRAARDHGIEAFYFLSQVCALFSTRLMRSVPTIIAMDATPINYDSLGAAYGHTSNPGSLAERIKLEINRRAFNASSAIVTSTEWAKKSLVEDYRVPADKVRVFDVGVNMDLWVPEGERHVDPGQKPNLLFVGGDFDRKGGPLLLQVFRDHFRGAAHLHLVTTSPVEPEPGVSIYSDIQANDPRLRKLYREADLFILPTLGDICPRVIPEAMALRIPIISTQLAGIPEMVEEGVTGLLFKPGDGEGLRQAIETLLGDPARRRSMGERGREVALERYDLRKNTSVLLDLMKSIARPAEAARSAS